MPTFVLIPGAGGSPWTWHLVAAELERRGYHDIVAVDLPNDDDSAGLAEYVDAALAAIGDRRTDLVVVAHSLGGFTATLLCDRVPVDHLLLVTAMIPAPGEAPGDWWTNTDFMPARNAEIERLGGDDSEETTFTHDVPPALASEAGATSATNRARRWRSRSRSTRCPRYRPISSSAPRTGSSRPTSCGASSASGLGITDPGELAAGHLPMFSRPVELVDWIERCIGAATKPGRRARLRSGGRDHGPVRTRQNCAHARRRRRGRGVSDRSDPVLAARGRVAGGGRPAPRGVRGRFRVRACFVWPDSDRSRSPGCATWRRAASDRCSQATGPRSRPCAVASPSRVTTGRRSCAAPVAGASPPRLGALLVQAWPGASCSSPDSCSGASCTRPRWGSFVVDAALVPVTAHHPRTGRAALAGVCVVVPMLVKRALGNARPSDPSAACVRVPSPLRPRPARCR